MKILRYSVSCLFFIVGHSALAQLTLPGIGFTTVSLPGISLPTSSLPGIGFPVIPFASTDCVAGTCSSVLPVTLLQLQGHRLDNDHVQLNWKTQNETSSKGFDIERSLGDAVSFGVVGNMQTNTSTDFEKNYVQKDNNSFSGTSFYRVKQLDIDGNFTYSNIIEVVGLSQQESLLLFPNPITTYTVAVCYALVSGQGVITIFSAHGQKIMQRDWPLSVGSNSLMISLSGASKGIYYLRMAWPDGHISTEKLVVEQ